MDWGGGGCGLVGGLLGLQSSNQVTSEPLLKLSEPPFSHLKDYFSDMYLDYFTE